MTDLQTAAQQALEALEDIGDEWGFTSKRTLPKRFEAVTALRTALEASQKNPVAWRTFDGEGGWDYRDYEGNEDYGHQYIKRNGGKYASWVEPLYTHPLPKTNQEPTAWIYEFWADLGHKGLSWERQNFADNTPLYIHPPQTKTNQCGETCERAQLCPACLSQL